MQVAHDLHNDTHIFDYFASVAQGRGRCTKHAGTCSLGFSPADVIDLATQGLPCQPFTRMRSSDATVEKHNLYGVVFDIFFKYLENHKPRGWITEEVMDFSKKQDSRGVSYYDNFARRAEDLGYTVIAFKMESSKWVAMDRDRLQSCAKLRCPSNLWVRLLFSPSQVQSSIQLFLPGLVPIASVPGFHRGSSNNTCFLFHRFEPSLCPSHHSALPFPLPSQTSRNPFSIRCDWHDPEPVAARYRPKGSPTVCV